MGWHSALALVLMLAFLDLTRSLQFLCGDLVADVVLVRLCSSHLSPTWQK